LKSFPQPGREKPPGQLCYTQNAIFFVDFFKGTAEKSYKIPILAQKGLLQNFHFATGPFDWSE